MTVTTPVYWTYKGVTLNTLAFNISTRGGSRMGSADPRGENQMIPGMTGRRYLPKYRDSRIITLGMWVRGSDVNGDRPTASREAISVQFDQNWDLLANLFDDDGQWPLVKRFRDGSGGYLTATALAEYAGGLDPDMEDEFKAELTPQLLLADPWFYSASAAGITGAATILGNRPTDHITVGLNAGEQVTWAGGTRWIKNNHSGACTIDIRERAALSGATYINGKITRDRTTADWMTLRPGADNFVFTGAGSLSYQAAWR